MMVSGFTYVKEHVPTLRNMYLLLVALPQQFMAIDSRIVRYHLKRPRLRYIYRTQNIRKIQKPYIDYIDLRRSARR